MNKALLLAFAILVCGIASADDSPAYVWSYPLQADRSSDIWRVALTEDIVQRLARDDARDLRIVDRNGRPVPFTRLDDRLLLEPVSEEQALRFDGRHLTSDNAGSSELVLEFDHDGSSLKVTAPGTDARSDSADQLRFEALLATPETVTGRSQSRLIVEFESQGVVDLSCWLRDAGDSGPATLRMPLTQVGQSRPRRYQGETLVAGDASAWHLSCYGPAPTETFSLVEVKLVTRHQRDHRPEFILQPDLSRSDNDDDDFGFTLPGPVRVGEIHLATDEPGTLSRVEVRSQPGQDDAWRSRGSISLSSIASRHDSPGSLTIDDAWRDRDWSLQPEPALASAPEIRVTVQADSLVFLSQGEPPWQLQVGGWQASEHDLDSRMIQELIQRIGPAWQWPVADLEPAERIGDDDLLSPPRGQPDWSRIALWTILILGTLIVAGMAMKLLKDEPGQS